MERSHTARSTNADRQAERHRMVELQLRERGITDERVLRAMESVPRHEFVPEFLSHAAYFDQPLPIGEGQTISQPYIVARSCELARVAPDANVLEIGAGSGYQAAVLGELARTAVCIELREPLARRARAALQRLGYDNVEIVAADGTLGYAARAPYDAIVVAASAAVVPPALIEQLAPGGRLVMPVGEPDFTQMLTVLHRTEHGIERIEHEACAFVPLRSGSDLAPSARRQKG